MFEHILQESMNYNTPDRKCMTRIFEYARNGVRTGGGYSEDQSFHHRIQTPLVSAIENTDI
ncbi:hypothetical protein DPMN_086307 [Dreissena polymorpha]|uniref:Uncharacterized protein n=2 Tax=Dreissena polymorpha TaxID=45954 RepID=A0A9D4KQM6_DREPO|nr:hypothetical protein DPMN_086307 [Dreissena polymorpha]